MVEEHCELPSGIELCYERFGEEGRPTILLVMGLGAQMIAWPDELCADLAGRGYRVVRFDNRDVGRSTHLVELGEPNPLRVLARRERPPYRLDQMAADCVGLIEHLGSGPVHLVGASMGGFIAQLVVVSRPELVRSVVLVMTSTGSRRVGHPSLKVLPGLRRRRDPGADREAAIATTVEIFRRIGSPAYPHDGAYLAELAGRSYDRGYDPGGYLRQLAAVLTQADRTGLLASVRVPATVIHGLADPLVSPSGGRALAAAIPGARFVGLPGMGHDLPRALWPKYADEISSTAAEGERRAGAVSAG